MSVSKITNAPSENEVIAKINEVIDNLGGGGGGSTYTAGTGIDITNDVISVTSPTQTTSNLVTSISSASTDTQYPSAKCVYDIVGDIETLLSQV